MLLRRLREYADTRMKLPPTLYVETPIRYIVELDENGKLLNPEPTDTADPGSPRTRRGLRRIAPQVQRAVGITPLLLADNAEYTFGLARETSKPDRVRACHRSYQALLNQCYAYTQCPEVGAVKAFIQNSPEDTLKLPDDFDRGSTITFRVDGQFVIDIPEVQDFWARVHDPAATDATIMQCVTCGEVRPVLDRLQAKIKGVPGGQTSGTSIISANADAFESYGLHASLVAPTCSTCGERFTQALNELLSNEASRIILGGMAFIFWTRDDIGFNYRGFMDEPTTEQIQALFQSVRAGRALGNPDPTAFYGTVLSGSGGRTVVRDWIDTTVGEVKEQLARWFALQRIVPIDGSDPRP
ncbi:MAG: type I-C CRISPR-associated protein Cas8c/Csd1, partial [Chloroflexota bacterium]